MSLLEQASLIVTPNAYKEDVLYSVVPSDGSGDMNVVRATTATRVNADGLIEVVPKNLVTYSEQFDNAKWIKQSSTIIENSTISPNGTLTADLLYPTSSGNYRAVRQLNDTLIGEINLSVYLKAQNKSKAYIRLDDAKYAIFDLINGTIVGYNSIEIPTIENVGNGWYRCSLNYNALSLTSTSFYLGIMDTSYPSVTANGTDGIYLWGAQTTNVFGATSYFPTTDRLNIPRLDYSGGGCPSILVEGQRTNLALYSEQFDVSPWATLGTVTITTNVTTAPDGNLTADLILGTNSIGNINQTISGTTGVVYTNSIYIKNNNSTQSQILIRNSVTVVDGKLNWSGNTLTSITNTIGTTAFQSVGNGWYRIVSTYTAVESVQRPRVTPTTGTNQSVYIWGAQLEEGSYPTSYIPTVASSVTRNADIINKTGISDLIGQTEGTLFLDFIKKPQTDSLAGYACLKSSNGREAIDFWNSFSGVNTYFSILVNNAIVSNYNLGNLPDNQNYKLAVSYKSGETKIFKDGILLTTLTDSFVFNEPLTNLELSSHYINRNVNEFVNQVLLFKTALTDEQCILLTGDSYASYAEMADALNYIIQ